MVTDIIEDATLVDDVEAAVITIGNDTPIVLSITDSKLLEYQELSKSLKIEGVKDSKNYKAVDELRKTVRKDRFAVNNHTENIKKLLNAYKSKLMREDERVSLVLQAIETECDQKQDVIDKEKERIKNEKEKAERELVENRTADLAKYNFPLETLEADALKKLSEPEFTSLLTMAKMTFDAAEAYKTNLEKSILQTQQTLQQQIDALKKEKDDLAARNAELEKQLQPPVEIPEPVAPSIEKMVAVPIEDLHAALINEASIPAIQPAPEPGLPVENIAAEENKPASSENTGYTDADRMAVLLKTFEAIVLPSMHERKNALIIGRIDASLEEIKDRLRAVVYPTV